MFKKNQNVNGLSFSMISPVDGTAVTTGTVWADLIQDGGVAVDLIAAPKHRANGAWTANISAAEMNYNIVGVTFSHASAIPVTYTLVTDTKITSDLNDFNPTSDTVVKANVYSINSNTDSAISLQQYIPRLDDNISSRSTFNYVTDIVNANVTMIDGSTVEVTNVVNANIYSINSNTDAAIMLQQFIPRIDTNLSDISVSGTVDANIVSVQGVAVTSIDDFKATGFSTFNAATDTVVKANVYSINSNTNSAVQLASKVSRLDDNISSRSSFVAATDIVKANVITINGISVETAPFSAVPANIVSVQGVAVTSIDDFKATGFSTFDSTTDLVNANVYSINSNTNSAVQLASKVSRMDDNISSRSVAGDQMDLVNAPNSVAISAIQSGLSTFNQSSDVVKANIVSVMGVPVASVDDFKATGFSTFDSTTDTVNANVIAIYGNTNSAVLLQQNVSRLDDNISSRSTFNPTSDTVQKANLYSINSNTQSAVLLQQRIPRMDDNISSRSVAGDQMDLVDAPNSTAITAIQSGLSTFDSTTDLVDANVYSINSNTLSAVMLQQYIPRIDTNLSSVDVSGIVNANVYSINGNTDAAILLQQRIPRMDDNISSRAVAGDEMNLVDAPNSTAITAIQSGLSTFDSTTDTVKSNVISLSGNTSAVTSLTQNIVRLDDNITGISVNAEAIAAEIFATNVDGNILFSQAVQRILAMVVNAQIITGTDPIILVGRNSANTANVVIQSHPVDNPTGRTVTFN